MKFKFKQIVTLFIASLFIISSPVSVFASSHTENSLVNIEVSDADGKVIIAQVPQGYADEYKDKLKDSNFKQEQIDMANADSRALPDGNLIARKYLYKSDIERAYNSVSETPLESLIVNVGIPAAVVKILKSLDVTAWGFMTTILLWGMEYVRIKPESWWNESYIQILNKSISYVRMSHIQNTKPTYPAAWLILERI